MAQPDPIDLNWLRNTFDDDAVLAELYTLYLSDTAKRLGEIRAALDKNNLHACGRTAHALKGSSGNVGAGHMRELAGRLEKHDWNANPAAGKALVADLETEFAGVQSFVQEFLNSCTIPSH